jgi:hypothetical protein
MHLLHHAEIASSVMIFRESKVHDDLHLSYRNAAPGCPGTDTGIMLWIGKAGISAGAETIRPRAAACPEPGSPFVANP